MRHPLAASVAVLAFAAASSAAAEEGMWTIDAFPADAFYTMGFECRASFVRYYIRLNGKEVDLFTIDDPSRVPQRPGQYLLNIWHANGHWTNGQSADYPANDSSMTVDWVKIWR